MVYIKMMKHKMFSVTLYAWVQKPSLVATTQTCWIELTIRLCANMVSPEQGTHNTDELQTNAQCNLSPLGVWLVHSEVALTKQIQTEAITTTVLEGEYINALLQGTMMKALHITCVSLSQRNLNVHLLLNAFGFRALNVRKQFIVHTLPPRPKFTLNPSEYLEVLPGENF